MRLVSLFGVLSALGSESHGAGAQDTSPLLARVEDRTRVGPRDRVVVRDPGTGVDRVVYRSEGHIPYQVVVSSSGRYLAFIEVVEPLGATKMRLVVVDTIGQIVRVLGQSAIHAPRGIVEYTWCCGGDKFAIIVGVVGEGGATGEATTLPAGVMLIDVGTGAEVHIEEVWAPQQIHWAAFDSSLYIKGAPQVPPGTPGPTAWPVYRYHVPSGRLSLTTRRGIIFSPDGKYYFEPSIEGAPFRLYRTTDDEDITASLNLPPEQVMWGPEFAWLAGVGHVLIFIEKPPRAERKPGQRRLPARLMDPKKPQLYPDRWNLAVDAETGHVIERFQGELGAGWKTNALMQPVERRTGIEFVRLRRP